MIINHFRSKLLVSSMLPWAVITVVLLGAALAGIKPSIYWLALLIMITGTIVLFQRPILGLLALVPAALVIPLEVGTGSAVAVNPATLLVPAVLALWFLSLVRQHEARLVSSRVNRPLILFLLGGLLSLLVGNVLWDPQVPRASDFIIVQLAQWAIFAFSAGAFWLTGNLIRDKVWLRRLTYLYLAVAGALAVLRAVPITDGWLDHIATIAVHRSPFWMLLTAMAGGQLFFDRRLSSGWRLFFLITLGVVLYYAFCLERATASNWIGVAAVLGIMSWLRWSRLRWPVILLLVVLTASGLLTSVIYEFAGGEAEWEESGGSRMALIGRVVEITMRNPVTGLGPAAYREYARMQPLQYGRALYWGPRISSHNNYVDLFSHVGLLGVGLFFWFAIEVTRLGFRLRSQFTEGFAAGYINAMIAAWVGALILMLFADWILPFVYNIGFPGFQASVLVWLFLGGLVALEQIARQEAAR